jgi:hypothetical protein
MTIMAQVPENNPPVNYEEKIAEQQAIVDKLAADYKKNPSEQLALQLKRRKDTVLHLRNLAKESAKDRAQQAAEKAKQYALGKAIVQVSG